MTKTMAHHDTDNTNSHVKEESVSSDEEFVIAKNELNASNTHVKIEFDSSEEEFVIAKNEDTSNSHVKIEFNSSEKEFVITKNEDTSNSHVKEEFDSSEKEFVIAKKEVNICEEDLDNVKLEFTEEEPVVTAFSVDKPSEYNHSTLPEKQYQKVSCQNVLVLNPIVKGNLSVSCAQIMINDIEKSVESLVKEELVEEEVEGTSHESRTAYNHTMAGQPDEPMDIKDPPLLSTSNLQQDAAASTSATPFTEPTIPARKSKAQKQREYRRRIAASRTPEQAIAARKLDAKRQRLSRFRKRKERKKLKSAPVDSSESTTKIEIEIDMY